MLTVPLSAWAFDRLRLWSYRAATLYIIDGDSLVVLTDGGFRGAAMPHIRIRGYSAPDDSEMGAHEATLRLARVLAGTTPVLDADDALAPIGKKRLRWPLRLVSLQRETVVAETTSFERYIADVFVVQRDGSLKDVRELLHA